MQHPMKKIHSLILFFCENEDIRMMDEAVIERPINSLFTTAQVYTDEECEVDKHVIAKHQIQIDESLIIDTNLLTVASMIRSGGQSAVYKGRYKGALVAVKLREPDEDPEHNDRILREIRIRSKLKHENLVKFIGAAVHPVCVIVMEYMKNGSLKNYLNKIKSCGGGGLELNRCLSFALDISKAMEYLHRNGIIHRDLKPDNLLVTDDHTKLKLGDFGLAREESMEKNMTAGIGTLRWMAPEIFGEGSLKRGEKIHYDHKVDIYSFSIVFWEMLTNSRPFEGMGNFQAAYAAKQKMLRPSLDKVPKEIAPLLESCWAADPSQRPEFSHITKALSEFLITLNPSPYTSPRLVKIEKEEDGCGGSGGSCDSGIGISQAAVADRALAAIAKDPAVQEVKRATIVNDTVVKEVKCTTIANDTAVKEVKRATIVNDTVVKEVKCTTIANDTAVKEFKEVKANVDKY